MSGIAIRICPQCPPCPQWWRVQLPFGSIFSTSACGLGITCTDTSSPTRRAAAAPASVAALTAPTSPRTMTVTYPAPMYSLPTRVTFAALTIASAASTEPMRPLVSTRPSASAAMCESGANSNRLPEMRQLRYHRRTVLFHHRFGCALMVCAAAAAVGACKRKEAAAPPLATPRVTGSHPRAPLGSPIDITYKFDVAPNAHFDQDYRVLVHVLDSDDEMMWTDDHNPPVPTTQWKPGQTVEYMRTVFVPVYPYIGEATIQLGLFSTVDQKRLALSGQDMGQRAYRVAKFQLLPQSENVFTVFKDGWHA